MATTSRKHWLCVPMLLGTVLFTGSACAADFQDCRLATDQELATMRGGFMVDVGGGQLLLSLGIERVTFINGELATATTPLANLPLQLVQNGPGNRFAVSGAVDLPPGTTALIQNSLDNQVIRNITLINATLATKELIRVQSVSSSLAQSRSYSSP